jgi:hypothetical protein
VQLVFRSYFFPLLSVWVDEVPKAGVIALAFAVPVALVLILRRLVRAKNHVALVAFAAGMLLFGATIVSYGRHPGLPSPFANAIRNFYLPMVLLLWSLIAVTRFEPRRTAAWAVAFAWFAAQIPYIPETRLMPDQRWEVYSERLKTGDAIRIPITPAGWNMDLHERRRR